MQFFCDTKLVWLTENQIHGLDKEEAEFLDFVQDRQQEIEKERQQEEMSALQELHVFFVWISWLQLLNFVSMGRKVERG